MTQQKLAELTKRFYTEAYHQNLSDAQIEEILAAQ